MPLNYKQHPSNLIMSVLWALPILILILALIVHDYMFGYQLVKHVEQANLNRSPAAINRAAMALSKPSSVFYGNSGMEISPDLITAYKVSQTQKSDVKMDRYIPTNMLPTDDSRQVMLQIADKTLSTWTDSDDFKKSKLGQVSKEVEENLSQEVVIPSAGKIDHKIGLSFEAFQTTAHLKYTGLTNADVKYNVAKNLLNAEISEPVFKANEIVLNHQVGASENISRLLMRWNF